jgi:hypothetical protein
VKKEFFFVVMVWLTACSPRTSDEYHQTYAYLPSIRTANRSSEQFTGTDPYYLVVLVDARHVDYSTPENYFSTLSYGVFKRQEPDIGHAWIILKGEENGIPYYFEGGHTGEYGYVAPKYFDHIVELAESEEEKDPVSYLYCRLPDGRLELGSGGHCPTFAVAFKLTKTGYEQIFNLIATYDFDSWGILGPNCVQFVRSCLMAVGLEINCEEIVTIPKYMEIRGEKVRLWEHASFSHLEVQTPEKLEQRLLEKVQEGLGTVAMRWYRKQHL